MSKLLDEFVLWFDANVDELRMPLETRGKLKLLVERARTETCGALRKNQLQHGEYYRGRSRNGGIARWNAEKGYFVMFLYSMGHNEYTPLRHMDDELSNLQYDGFRPDQHVPLSKLGADPKFPLEA